MDVDGNEREVRENQPRGQQDTVRAIEDEEEWLRRNGILSEDSYGQLSERNQREAHAQVSRERRYQESVHEKLFKDEMEQELTTEQLKQQQLKRWEDAATMITVVTSVSSYEVPLHFLASWSDTVYTMALTPASNVLHSSPAATRPTIEARKVTQEDAIEEENKSDVEMHGDDMFRLSLEEFDDGAVDTFLKVISACCQGKNYFNGAKNGLASNQEKPNSKISKTVETKEASPTSKKRSKVSHSSPVAQFQEEEVRKEELVRRVVLTQIPDDHLIDCCRLAHYLQCTPIVDEIVRSCLIPSVDTANCLSLVQLADSLELTNLLEASLSHMMQSLTNLEEHTVWDDFSPELKDRIGTIRMLLSESHPQHAGSGTGGSKLSKLYFTSFQEYLAIFAEQVEYYRERLHDAKTEQERYVEESIRGSVGPGWRYAQNKIDMHERRVNSLRQLLAQQKRLFSMSAST